MLKATCVKATCGLLLMTGLVSVSAAQTTLPAPEHATPPRTQLESKIQNGIRTLCGGIGADEAASMKQMASKHHLMLTFASDRGAYLADVHIDIADTHGSSLLKTTCDAPIMLIDFPGSGAYLIRAETGGRTLSRTIRIRTGHNIAISMLWPVKSTDADQAAMPDNGQPEPTINNPEASGATVGGTR